MEKFSKIIVLTIIGLSAAGALYVCCSHTLSHRSRTAEIDIPSKPSLPEVRRAPLVFAGGERRVKVAGEAMFDVEHDPAHPFVVFAGT